ncbi:XrtA/PEP-CTERM system histidine kinase PrsK [Vibrio ulleungensis]|uniref:histidine kinase n=1 Tax=Vibrio ulleungensis TaxID=2807619 RepID=A0ABS2HLS0_9VIBR|nr:XrtA/PEP-CTERM system histidine kinase PrsK [Vibrio ulleungensis]MBM7037004.1 PEP-CTERM system histidine kinase PrsK [Vibrio ulleungensis]
MIEAIRLGYFIASLVYLVLIVVILINRKRVGMPHPLHVLLILLGGAFSYYAYLLFSEKGLLTHLLSLHLLYTSALIALLIRKSDPDVEFKGLLLRPLNGLLFLCSVVVVLVELNWVRWSIISSSQLYLVHLSQMVIGLLAVERYWRRNQLNRWVAKPLTLYGVVFFASGGLVFSAAILSGSFYSFFIEIFGWILVVIAPLIALDIRRQHGANERSLYLSRDVVYSGSVLVFLGGFLLVVSLVYAYVESHVETQYYYFEFGLLAALGLAIAMFIFMGRLRKEMKVFIGKHFYTNKYDYRSEWLRFTQNLTQGREQIFESSLTSIMAPFDAKVGALYLIEGQNMLLKASVGERVSRSNETLPTQVMQSLIQQKWILDFEHLSDEELKRFNVTIDDVEALQPFTLFVPFTCNETHGVFMLSNLQSGFDLDYEDRDFLNVLASHIAVNLHLDNTHAMLNQSQQFESFHRTSAFVLHDLKNVSAQLNLITQNASAHRDNPEFISDTFDTVAAASQRLDKTVKQLTQKQQYSEDNKEWFSIIPQIEEALNCSNSEFSELELVFSNSADGHLFADRETFTNILTHLITNALQAKRNEEYQHRVEVQFINAETAYVIKIADNGTGMEQTFIDNKLFKPFYTTKGNSGMGIGAFEAKSFVESMSGTLLVKSQVGVGSEFQITLPKTEKGC